VPHPAGEKRQKRYDIILLYWQNSIIDYAVCLQETEGDQLPKNMCGECTQKLDLLSDFREKAFKTETALLTMADLQKVKVEVYNIKTRPVEITKNVTSCAL